MVPKESLPEAAYAKERISEDFCAYPSTAELEHAKQNWLREVLHTAAHYCGGGWSLVSVCATGSAGFVIGWCLCLYCQRRPAVDEAFLALGDWSEDEQLSVEEVVYAPIDFSAKRRGQRYYVDLTQL